MQTKHEASLGVYERGWRDAQSEISRLREQIAARKLRLDRMPERVAARLAELTALAPLHQPAALAALDDVLNR